MGVVLYENGPYRELDLGHSPGFNFHAACNGLCYSESVLDVPSRVVKAFRAVLVCKSVGNGRILC